MNHKKKKPCGNMAKSKYVQLEGKNKSKDNIIKRPTKAESCIQAFIKRGSLNTWESREEYFDSCLHTTISYLNIRHGLEFDSRFEDIGAKRPFKRYTPKDFNEMKRVLNNMRIARGVWVKL